MAWLNATPKPPEGTKRAEKKIESAISRREQMKRDGADLRMPPNPAPHLVDRLIEIGLTESNGMGTTPLSWREIEAWQANTGVDLSAFEAKVIRRLSVEYVAESRRAESENCPAPWRVEVTPREREIAEAKLRLVLG